MFFVSLLLNEIVAWMRRQSGTSSLRAIVYMDEIAGYFPPVANPPAKAPLLTLLKQGRAFGIGVVLATQNTVDLDYKGLGNTGTWFLGRLQTERDKARVLDGLEGAAGGSLDRAGRGSGALGPGQARLPAARRPCRRADHVPEPLGDVLPAGPLSREQIRTLMATANGATSNTSHGRTRTPARPQTNTDRTGHGSTRINTDQTNAADQSGSLPILAPGVQQYFLPAAARESALRAGRARAWRA